MMTLIPTLVEQAISLEVTLKILNWLYTVSEALQYDCEVIVFYASQLLLRLPLSQQIRL